jgi:hypothetical protein
MVSIGRDLPTLDAKLLLLLLRLVLETASDSLAVGPTKRHDQVDEIGIAGIVDSSTGRSFVDNFLSSASGPGCKVLLLLLLLLAAAAALLRRLSLMSELNLEAKMATLLGGMAIETLKPGTTFLWKDDDNEGRRRTLRGRWPVIKLPALPPPPLDKLLLDGADAVLLLAVVAVVAVSATTTTSAGGLWQRR